MNKSKEDDWLERAQNRDDLIDKTIRDIRLAPKHDDAKKLLKKALSKIVPEKKKKR